MRTRPVTRVLRAAVEARQGLLELTVHSVRLQISPLKHIEATDTVRLGQLLDVGARRRDGVEDEKTIAEPEAQRAHHLRARAPPPVGRKRADLARETPVQQRAARGGRRRGVQQAEEVFRERLGRGRRALATGREHRTDAVRHGGET